MEKELSELATNTGRISYYYEDATKPVPIIPDSFPCSDGTTQSTNDEHVFLGNGDLIPIRTFMRFKITNTGKATDERKIDVEKFHALVESFCQTLTNTGKSVFFRLKNCISERIKIWKDVTAFFASPNASLCQYSGAGKSKMAHELTQQGPGICITLRSTGDDEAYPPSNNLSSQLLELITADNLDPSVDLSGRAAHTGSKIATLLNFFASLTTNYMQELVNCACFNLISEHGTKCPQEVLLQSYSKVGPKLPKSTNQADSVKYDYPLSPQTFEEMLPFYQHALGRTTQLYYSTKLILAPIRKTKHMPKHTRYLNIDDISNYIEALLKNPLQFLTKADNIDDFTFAAICEALKQTISSFPFILVIDEAHLLANLSFDVKGRDMSSVKFTGFQILRRALTYLKQKTSLFVLTLGTKSVLLDMNPPDIDSFRLNRAVSFMPPMVLSGNFDIFSHVKGFNAARFEPTYEALRNPLVFKLLVSLGSPLWSSLLFDSVVETAIFKLKNSTCAKKEDVFVSWMIRIGAMANPKSAETELLVAKRMACLFNLASDLKTMSAFYPPQPILGIAARKIIQDDKERVEESLFSSLAGNSSVLDLNLGEVAEGIAFMNALLAIDASENVSFSCKSQDEYKVCLEHICKECPELTELWMTESFLLEKPIKDEEDGEIDYFEGSLEDDDSEIEVLNDPTAPLESDNLDDMEEFSLPAESVDESALLVNESNQFDFNSVYHVTTVREFLLKHYGESISEQLKSFPEVVLDGLVNATHFAKLPSNPSFDTARKAGYSLPVPNNVKGNGTRHYIDRSLLRLGLVRQCGFSMPPDYFGADGIIPVCLNVLDSDGRPIYTFIAIQVKKGKRATLEDALDMQARLHYINCPYADSHPTTEPVSTCPHCVKSKGMDVVFGNQIALLVSFTDPYVENQATNSLFQYGSSVANPKGAFSELYGPKRKPLHNKSPLAFKRSPSRPPSLASPRTLHTIHFGRSFRIHAALWQDSLVDKKSMKNLTIKTAVEASTLAKKLNVIRRNREPRKQSLSNRRHRLFCISTDGIKSFKHLYGKFSNESFAKAKILLDPNNYLGSLSTVDLPCMIGALMRESIIPDYNHTLLEWRGIPMTAKNRRKHYRKLLSRAVKSVSVFNSRNTILNSFKNN